MQYTYFSFIQKLLFLASCRGCGKSMGKHLRYCIPCYRSLIKIPTMSEIEALFFYDQVGISLIADVRRGEGWRTDLLIRRLLRKGQWMEEWRKEGIHFVVLAPSRNENISYLQEVAYWIAKELRAEFQPGILLKINNISQHGRGAKERIDQRCFVKANADFIHGKKVLLIDDVYSTGTTLEQCEYVLREAGAKNVIPFTLAYNPP